MILGMSLCSLLYLQGRVIIDCDRSQVIAESYVHSLDAFFHVLAVKSKALAAVDDGLEICVRAELLVLFAVFPHDT